MLFLDPGFLHGFLSKRLCCAKIFWRLFFPMIQINGRRRSNGVSGPQRGPTKTAGSISELMVWLFFCLEMDVGMPSSCFKS